MGRSSDISARTLHNVIVRLQDRTLIGASVFPLFDREGTVWKLMIVWRGSDRILLLDYAAERIRQTWWGFLVDAALDDERPLTKAAVAGIGRLWHFDPWWLLRSVRFARHPAVQRLEATNLLGPIQVTIYRLSFTADLSRVSVWSSDRIGPMAPFDGGDLPARVSPDREEGRRLRPAWVLKPLWLPE